MRHIATTTIFSSNLCEPVSKAACYDFDSLVGVLKEAEMEEKMAVVLTKEVLESIQEGLEHYADVTADEYILEMYEVTAKALGL